MQILSYFRSKALLKIISLCFILISFLCFFLGAEEKPIPPAVIGTIASSSTIPTTVSATASEENESTLERVQIIIEPEGVSVYAVNVEVQEFFTKLGQKTGFKIIVDDTIRRKVTVNLSKRKVSEIIDNIVAAYGFSCSCVNGIFMISEGIPQNPSSYLLSDIDAIRTKYVLATNAKSLLPLFLQDNVKVNPEQNAVILSAPTEVLKKFREDIDQFDKPAQQIMIEVLMVEFTDLAARQFAFNLDWKNGKHAGSVISSLVQDMSPVGELTYRGIANLPKEFFAQLRALVIQGKARVHANPSIATVSGQRASIFIGKQKYLSTPVQIGGEEGYGRQINYIDAGVKLEITPWTGGGGEIIAQIEPEISVMGAPDPITRLPEKSSRRARTMVRVHDGEWIIIGGLIQRELHALRTKVPLLGDIPLIGQLFRSEDTKETTTELVIFIRPRILSLTGHLSSEEEKQLQEKFLKPEEK